MLIAGAPIHCAKVADSPAGGFNRNLSTKPYYMFDIADEVTQQCSAKAGLLWHLEGATASVHDQGTLAGLEDSAGSPVFLPATVWTLPLLAVIAAGSALPALLWRAVKGMRERV